MSLNHKFQKNSSKGLDGWNITFLVLITALLISAIVKAVELYYATR